MTTPKVLLIDDEIELLSSYSQMLHLLGYETSIAITGEQGLRLLKKDDFDVVVLEPKVANGSTLNLLREMKPTLKSSPEVIILTNFPSMDSGLQWFEYGISNYLIKPIKIKELADKISEARERKLLKQSGNNKKDWMKVWPMSIGQLR